MTEALQQLMPQIYRLTAAERDELLDFVLATLEEDRAKQNFAESENAKDAGVADKPFVAESRKEFP